MMAVGATGVISVFSNVCPKGMSELTHAALEGDWTRALKLHRKYYRLFGDLFIETNPIPVKTALAMMGRLAEEFRLPLCAMEPQNRQKLEASLKAVGLL